jgi:hypothetical protein
MVAFGIYELEKSRIKVACGSSLECPKALLAYSLIRVRAQSTARTLLSPIQKALSWSHTDGGRLVIVPLQESVNRNIIW